MAGGLMQLVAYGRQDIHLTGNPQITFFKVVYRRHTNFAMESIQQTVGGRDSWAKLGQKISCTFALNGDLLGRVYLEMDVNAANFLGAGEGDGPAFGERVGHAAIDYIECEIGGQCIDKQYGEWMDIWAQLSSSNEQWTKLNRLVNGTLPSNRADGKVYVPLQFWFCRNPGLAIPLISLRHNHEVKLNVKFNNAATLAGIGDINNFRIFADYFYLDTDERRRFAQVSHQYLIEQVQFSNTLSQGEGSAQHELRFKHPVKELVWALKDNSYATDGTTVFDYFDHANKDDICQTALLKLNGRDRFSIRDGAYFRCVQPFQHHTGGHQQKQTNQLGGFYCYSFGLNPEEHQPSGTCNFSRIDNAVLNVSAQSASKLKVWAVNYNVLRITRGMGGLAYK